MIYWPRNVLQWQCQFQLKMRLLVITLIVILQRSCHGSEFVLLEAETGTVTGNEEDPASSSNGDYQDASNQAEFGCRDCKIDMKQVYGHIPCSGCDVGNPQGSPFSCKACVFGEFPKFNCDSCKKNGNEKVVPKKKLLYTDRKFKYYKVTVAAGTRMGTQHWGPGWEHGSRERDQVKSAVIETCEAAGLKSVCTGGPGCKHYHPDKCVVTPLSTHCSQPL